MALGKYKLALRDYERVCKVRPNDKDAKQKFTECRKIVQQIAFNKAIAVEEKAASVAENIDIESMQVSFYHIKQVFEHEIALLFALQSKSI